MNPEMMGAQQNMQNMQPPTGMGMGENPVIQDEMKKSLLGMYNKVKSKKQQMDASVDPNSEAALKMQALKSFFDAFENAGINPSDSLMMRDFFEKLYNANPDLYALIIPIIDDILGPEGPDENQQMAGG